MFFVTEQGTILLHRMEATRVMRTLRWTDSHFRHRRTGTRATILAGGRRKRRGAEPYVMKLMSFLILLSHCQI